MSGPGSKFWKNHKKTIILSTIIVIFVIGGSAWLIAGSPQTEEKKETPTTRLASTFELYSYVDGEDVSEFQEITIWVPKDSATFDDDEDEYRLSTNYEKEVTSKDADDVSIDLRKYNHTCWLEIEDNSVFANTYIPLYYGANYEYRFPDYDLSSDVNFNMHVRDTLAAVTVADYQTNGNFTIIMDVDHEVTSNCHYGDDWAISTEDFNDMTLSEKKDIWDEANYQCQAPLYDPTVDEEKDYSDALERLTDAFALRIQCNGSISTVDGNAAQLNISINDSDEPIEIIISGEYVYLVFYEVIDFKESAYTFDLEMTFAANITLSDIDSGRVVVPRDDENLGAFTKYSDIGA